MSPTSAPSRVPLAIRTVFTRLRVRGVPWWARYLTVTALTFGVFAGQLRLGVEPPGFSFLLFFPVVIASAVVFDRGSGIFAGVLTTVLTFYFFEPAGSIDVLYATDLLQILVYGVIAVLSAFLIEALHLAYMKLEDAHQELIESHRELTSAEGEKSLILQELVHRVRNDMATMAAFVRIKGRSVVQDEARSALESTAERIQVMSRVHNRLSMHQRAISANSQEFLSDLCTDLRSSIGSVKPIAIELDAETHALPLRQAVSTGLIVNELVTNALKYAFPGDRAGIVRIAFRRENGSFALRVEDNGVGISGPVRGSGLGHTLVRGLTQGLHGQMTMTPLQPGTAILVTFPVTEVPSSENELRQSDGREQAEPDQERS